MEAQAKEAEWLNFDQALGLMKTAGTGLEPHRVLADWCGKKLVEARAATVTGGQGVEHDMPIDPMVFEHAARRKSGVNFSYWDGSLSCKFINDDSGKEERWSAIGLSFRKDQLCKLLPHLTDAKVEAALADGKLASVLSEAPQLSEPEPTPSRRGRRPDLERWKSFYFAAIELAKDGRLNADCFPTAASLSEELLLMMGEAAYDPKHIEATVSQLYRKFVEPN